MLPTIYTKLCTLTYFPLTLTCCTSSPWCLPLHCIAKCLPLRFLHRQTQTFLINEMKLRWPAHYTSYSITLQLASLAGERISGFHAYLRKRSSHVHGLHALSEAIIVHSSEYIYPHCKEFNYCACGQPVWV